MVRVQGRDGAPDRLVFGWGEWLTVLGLLITLAIGGAQLYARLDGIEKTSNRTAATVDAAELPVIKVKIEDHTERLRKLEDRK